MQSLLTFAAEFTFVSGIALYSYLAIAGFSTRTRFIRTASPDPASPLITAEEEALIPQITDLWKANEPEKSDSPVVYLAPVVSDAVVPFVRRKVDLTVLTIRQLKAIAKAVKLPKYNYCTKVELIDRLSALCPLEVGQALKVA